MQPELFAAHHRAVLDELERLGALGESFTLCMVLHSAGSTYRKAGALALVKADGGRRGVISGGCLESQLELAAKAALAELRPHLVLFDTRTDDDVVFGSGSGCRGLMQILLVPAAAGTHPLCRALSTADGSQEALTAALVTSGPNLGTGFLWFGDSEISLAPGIEWVRSLRSRPPGEYRFPDGASCVVVSVAPSPRILVIGAGPEAPALIAMAKGLGMRVAVSDHREPLLMSHAAAADLKLCARPARALDALSDQHFDACVVMTHSAVGDCEALAALAWRSDPFIGLLGPPARRDELLAQIDGNACAALAGRLHAPVGLKLGGHGPEVLALSICAELQQFFTATSRPRTEFRTAKWGELPADRLALS